MRAGGRDRTGMDAAKDGFGAVTRIHNEIPQR